MLELLLLAAVGGLFTVLAGTVGIITMALGGGRLPGFDVVMLLSVLAVIVGLAGFALTA